MNVEPDMAISFVGLFVLAGLAALVFLAVLGLITLLTSPKTRDVAKILLIGLPAMTLLALLLGGLFLGVARTRFVAEQEIVHREMATEHLQELGQQFRHDNAAENSRAGSNVALPPDPRNGTGSEGAVESGESKTHETVDEENATAEVKLTTEESTEEAATAPEEPDESDVGELSVAPLTDDNRPAWVDREPYKEGSIYYWPVAADPHPDVDQAEFEALPEALDAAVADYIEAKLRLGSDASRQIHLASDYVRNDLVGEDIWIEPVSLSVGEFVRMHALVKFDREANLIIRDQWEQQSVESRLWYAVGFLAMILLLLALVYCYLKIDQVTGGSRRGLLRFAAILVILGLTLLVTAIGNS